MRAIRLLVVLLATAGVVACGSDDGDDATCVQREIVDPPEAPRTSAVGQELVAVVALNPDISPAEASDLVGSLGLHAWVSVTPDYLANRLFVSAPGSLSESQLAAIFEFAQTDPRVERLDGIICAEPG